MEPTVAKPPKKYSVTLVLFLCCLAIFVAGQIIPVYFTNPTWRIPYYTVVFILLVITGPLALFRLVYNPHKDNNTFPVFVFFMSGASAVVVFGIWTLCILSCVWSQASTYYIRKDHPQVKIISRYADNGAFGGGTSHDDFKIAYQRPFLYAFKIEIPADTTLMNMDEWVRATN